jgi:hypothetical protein
MQEFNWNLIPVTLQPVQVTSTGVDSSADVAASNGSFVITWTHSKGTDLDVQAERFIYKNGKPVGQGITTLPNMTANNEFAPTVAMSPAGRYDIAYAQFGSVADIQMARYDGAGGFLGTAAVNTDANLETAPSVSMDNQGNAVVAYQEFITPDWGIYANRVSSTGVVGARITVRDAGGGFNETAPAVALAPTGGVANAHLFVVAYDTPNGVQVTEMSETDTPLATLGPVTGALPAISIDGSNRYLVTYHRHDNSGHEDIYSRRDFLSD